MVIGGEELKRQEMKLKSVVVFSIFLILLAGCKKTYEPVYYPNKNNLTEYIEGPKFTSVEEAREWVYEVNRLKGDHDWDYEIGVNCKPSKYGDIKICEDTIR